jgi:hypothetical protein
MDKKYIYYLVITVMESFFVLYFYNTQINKPTFGLEVDPTKDTTDISGIQYRVRITNVGKKQLTGIVVDLGKNDVQRLSLLDPGQSYYFHPKTDTLVSNVKVMTNEGIYAQAGYRSPTKVLGLPGTGR